MSDDLISIIDFAAQHGLRKQTIFKVLKRLGIEPAKRRGPGRHGQIISYITLDDARIVVDEFRSRKQSSGACDENPGSLPDELLAEQGVFYLISLEPDGDPGRFKIGFAGSLPERLRALRCSAPFATVIATWPCKRLWEKTAIECVSDGCERIHTEVFRSASVASVRERCDRFFGMMPKLTTAG